MDNLSGLLRIRRTDRMTNARIRELCGVTNVVEERVDENVLGWFVHTERIWIDRNAIRVYMGGPVPMCTVLVR